VGPPSLRRAPGSLARQLLREKQGRFPARARCHSDHHGAAVALRPRPPRAGEAEGAHGDDVGLGEIPSRTARQPSVPKAIIPDPAGMTTRRPRRPGGDDRFRPTIVSVRRQWSRRGRRGGGCFPRSRCRLRWRNPRPRPSARRRKRTDRRGGDPARPRGSANRQGGRPASRRRLAVTVQGADVEPVASWTKAYNASRPPGLRENIAFDGRAAAGKRAMNSVRGYRIRR